MRLDRSRLLRLRLALERHLQKENHLMTLLAAAEASTKKSRDALKSTIR